MIEDEAKKEPEQDDGQMKIVVARPPIWEEAHKHFRINDEMTVYTYGDTLYNPSDRHIPNHLYAHEATHADQQLEFEGGPEAWWKLYFADEKFRQDQELKAYHNQYQYYCASDRDRNRRARFLHEIAADMASPLYNAGITHVDAMRIIKGNVK